MLTPEEVARYHRQLVLPELGTAGQERLRAARVLIVGAGGLGSPAALYLAAAGVGTIGIVDDDVLDVSNLHRQVLHRTTDVGRPKVESAADAIRALNPLVAVKTHGTRLEASGARALFEAYDVIVDGSDNYPTRYVINDACVALRKAWVYGSVERFAGQVSVFGFGGGPCYRCIFPEAPAPGASASCEEIGVLGAVPGVVGALQATETLKVLTGIGEPLAGRLLQLDLLHGSTRTIEFARDSNCPSCGRANHPAPDAAADLAPTPFDIAPSELAGWLKSKDAPVVLDVRERWEWDIARIPGAQLLPLSELEQNVRSVDARREFVVYCHTGVRSRMATTWLRSQGFRARNMVGGIERWSADVDPTVPRY